MDSLDEQKINALSARLDERLQALNSELEELYQQRFAARGQPRRDIEAQIAERKALETKLLKSKNLAWTAHQLRRDGEIEITETPYRKLGLALILISLAGALGLGLYLWYLY